ncbi:CdiA family toxin C-terminal domain-containing protein [Herbaspirillum robiniae]|uniref:CdiA family toxin C-terminal domain-containing protein n=1 Tax=Herbaspirillum robiniae TaxID=2014887 RepID=UPI003D77B0F7
MHDIGYRCSPAVMVFPQVTAGNDINNVAATDASSESHYRKEATSGVFSGGDAVIPVRQDLIEHLTAAKVSGKHISGGRNESNFMTTLNDAKGTVVSNTEIAPGVMEIEYRLANKSYLSKTTGLEEFPKKTVYDPKIYSDAKMADMAQEAAARGMIQYQVDGKLAQPIKINGIDFSVRINSNTRTIQTVFPSRAGGAE